MLMRRPSWLGLTLAGVHLQDHTLRCHFDGDIRQMPSYEATGLNAVMRRAIREQDSLLGLTSVLDKMPPLRCAMGSRNCGTGDDHAAA